MTRRTATLVTSIVVLVISLGLVTVFPVPFVAFSPGPVKNTHYWFEAARSGPEWLHSSNPNGKYKVVLRKVL